MQGVARSFDNTIAVLIYRGDVADGEWEPFVTEVKEILTQGFAAVVMHFRMEIPSEMEIKIRAIAKAAQKVKVVVSGSKLKAPDAKTLADGVRATKLPIARKVADLLGLEDQIKKIRAEIKQADSVLLTQLNNLLKNQKLEENTGDDVIAAYMDKLTKEIARLKLLRSTFVKEIEVLKKSEKTMLKAETIPQETKDAYKAMQDKTLKALKESGLI